MFDGNPTMKTTSPMSPKRGAIGTTRLALAAALGLAAISPAGAVMLDDFNDGEALLEFPTLPVPPGGWLRADTAASVPGGFRSLALQPLAGSTTLVFIGLDRLGLEAYRTPTQALYTGFGYGQNAPMNLDLGGQLALRLDVVWAGATTAAGPWDNTALALTVYATTSNGAGFNPNGSAAHAVLLGGRVLDLPLASFSTNSSTGLGVDWRDVDSLLFVVNEAVLGATSAGFGIASLSTVSAVPEPATWALLALGVPAIAWRRWRSTIAAR